MIYTYTRLGSKLECQYMSYVSARNNTRQPQRGSSTRSTSTCTSSFQVVRKKTTESVPRKHHRDFFTHMPCAMCHVCVWEATYRAPCLLRVSSFFSLSSAFSQRLSSLSSFLFSLFAHVSPLSLSPQLADPHAMPHALCAAFYVCTTRGELRHRHARTPPAPTRPHTPHRSIKPEATPWRHTGAAPTLHKATAQRVLALRRRAAWDKETHATTMTTTTRHTRAHAHDTRHGARFSVLFFSRLPFSLARLRLHLFLLQWFVSFVIPPLFVHSSPRGATTSS